MLCDGLWISMWESLAQASGALQARALPPQSAFPSTESQRLTTPYRQAVESGDGRRESAGFRQRLRVKLFAKSGEANKPRDAPSYNLQLTLFI
jgi:hypothetical protein